MLIIFRDRHWIVCLYVIRFVIGANDGLSADNDAVDSDAASFNSASDDHKSGDGPSSNDHESCDGPSSDDHKSGDSPNSFMVHRTRVDSLFDFLEVINRISLIILLIFN